MEKTNLAYNDWPEWIKVLTARYVKAVIVKDPKTVRTLSYFSFIIGIGVIVMGMNKEEFSGSSFGEKLNFTLIFLGILNILLGLINFFVNYKMYNWVLDNSSWEERFAHKSSGKHQIQYLLMYLILIGISWAAACFICC